jgi:uncharacterized protein (DUF885 family)
MNLRATVSIMSFVIGFGLAACGESTSVSQSSGSERSTTALAQESEQTEDARLAAFFEEVFERQLAQSPQLKSQLGMRDDDYGRLDDYTDAFAELQNEETREDLRGLREEFDFDALSEASKVSYLVFEYSAELSAGIWQHSCRTSTKWTALLTPRLTSPDCGMWSASWMRSSFASGTRRVRESSRRW